MTPKVFFERLRTFLKEMYWGANSQPENLVFGHHVYIVPEIPIISLSQYISPSAFIQDAGAVSDPEEAQNFTITIFCENVQSPFGEGSMIGANRVDETSQGAGILDLEDEVLSKIYGINTLSSAKISLIEKSTPSPQIVKGNFPSVLRPMTFYAITSIY